MVCKRHRWEFMGAQIDEYNKCAYELKWCAKCGAVSEWLIKGKKQQRLDIRLPGEKREQLKDSEQWVDCVDEFK